MAHSREELASRVADWEDLASEAVEPNVFYEPWMLIPALEAYGKDRDLSFVFVYAERENDSPLLCGFFPMERSSRYHGLPLSGLGLWKYVHCFLCTPLVRRGYARRCLEAFFDWLLARSPRPGVFHFPQVTAQGAVGEALHRCLERHGLRFAKQEWERAFFSPRTDGYAYLREALSRRGRKELRRLVRRMAERGGLEMTLLASDAAVEVWLDEFLRLEGGGWKGRAGTALASSATDRTFFRTVATEAFRRGRLMMLSLRLDGSLIAQKCNFLAGDGSFAFKIAFDEDYRAFSPGVLLEIENIRLSHGWPDLRWMDSCAIPDHPMADRLWVDRRKVQTLLVATGSFASELVVRVIPAVQRVARRILGGLPQASGAGATPEAA